MSRKRSYALLEGDETEEIARNMPRLGLESIFKKEDDRVPVGTAVFCASLTRPIFTRSEVTIEEFAHTLRNVLGHVRCLHDMQASRSSQTKALGPIREELHSRPMNSLDTYRDVLRQCAVHFHADEDARAEFPAFLEELQQHKYFQRVEPGGSFRRVWTGEWPLVTVFADRLSDKEDRFVPSKCGSPFPFFAEWILWGNKMDSGSEWMWYTILWCAVGYPRIARGLFSLLLLHLTMWEIPATWQSKCSFVAYAGEGLRLLTTYDVHLRNKTWITPEGFYMQVRHGDRLNKTRRHYYPTMVNRELYTPFQMQTIHSGSVDTEDLDGMLRGLRPLLNVAQ